MKHIITSKSFACFSIVPKIEHTHLIGNIDPVHYKLIFIGKVQKKTEH